MGVSLIDVYVRHAGGDAPAADESELAAVCARAAAAYPELAVDAEAIVALMARRGQRAADEDGAAELALACACSRGEARALSMLERRYLDVVPAALAPMRLGADAVDEVTQRVREKLLVAEGGERPRLERYAGDGKLRSLVHVMAVRTALDRLRRQRREQPVAGEMLDAMPETAADPELAFLQRTYRAAFKTAFEGALADLDERERNLLRLHLLGGITLERLAGIYGVHRATVVRWLARAREHALAGTRRRMGASLGVAEGELDSIMALIASRLDASISRVLGAPGST